MPILRSGRFGDPSFGGFTATKEQVMHSLAQLRSVNDLRIGDFYVRRSTRHGVPEVFRVVGFNRDGWVTVERPFQVKEGKGGTSELSLADIGLKAYEEGTWNPFNWVESATKEQFADAISRFK